MAKQQIKIKMSSYDHRKLDRAMEEIVNTVKRTGAEVKGPIPLPTEILRITTIRSPHVDKKSREHFDKKTHKRIIFIEEPSPQTMDAFMKLDLPADVEVSEIKLMTGNE